ncbi:heterokaryon incompatibility protein-domain-containing protein [Colletotrichum acutatum]|uniref:Heterokaryon incompatibility protein-domain-containing protein n=1 Tax=Glomerella acutata TaxID=27357 RepID=A0AAD8U4A7_GLOAC|nr:heterokaryon incompatibility protein-domain-containing protein [Colletotrichum acutatum]KAK1702205.1 heterokaryon incompatibility protein-domain-containing protein [Colletotrichum acutatum]
MNLCGLCGVYKIVVEAVIDGRLPALFQGARNETERDQILDELVVGSIGLTTANTEESMDLLVKGAYVRVSLFIAPEEQSVFRVSSNGDEEVGFPKETQYGPSTDSIRSFARARQWLRQCLDHHDCGKNRDLFYPRRLLDLRDDQVRLIETTKTNDFQGPYVCLSHRWGDAKFSRLISTTETIHSRMEGIKWEEIPKTFQDAITICRRLSVDYLWIDTLCILQGFPEMSDKQKRITGADFAAENSAMARIYRNSYFTIYASVSTSMASGIFSSRRYESHQIKVSDVSGNESILRIRETTSHFTPPTDLETRGWTFQEYLLPCRVIEFGPFDISWKCNQTYVCECRHNTGAAHWREELARRALPPQNAAEAEEWWAGILRQYTMRHLAKDEDKLPALSGLAQLYRQLTRDTYLAAARAPSWSWASLDIVNDAQCRFWWPRVSLSTNPLMYGDGATPRPVCTVYEASCQPMTDGPFGEVIGGFVDLGVMLISARIGIKPQGNNSFSTAGHVAWTLDYVEDGTDVQVCLADCSLDDDGLQVEDEVFCAPIVETLSESESDRGCLVLKRMSEGSEFRRVGFAVLRKQNPSWDRANGPLRMDRGWGYNEPDLTTPEYAEKVQSYALSYNSNVLCRIRII